MWRSDDCRIHRTSTRQDCDPDFDASYTIFNQGTRSISHCGAHELSEPVIFGTDHGFHSKSGLKGWCGVDIVGGSDSKSEGFFLFKKTSPCQDCAGNGWIGPDVQLFVETEFVGLSGCDTLEMC